MPLRYCPTSIYKYCDSSSERIDSLFQGLIRYTPLGAFNDPFEGRPSITGLAPDDEVEKVIRESIPEAISQLYSNLSPEQQSTITFEEFSVFAREVLSGTQNEVIREVRDNLPEISSALSKVLDAQLGACSFSEVHDSILMWAHYCQWHTGFVIEFNAHHPHFHERLSEQDELRHLRRVLYRGARPRGHLTSFNGADLFLIKSEHWAYEREWRIIRPLADATKVVTTSGGSIHLLNFPLDAITSIILGARIRPETEERLRSFAMAVSKKAEVRVKRVIPDDSDFVLRIRDVI